MRKNCERKIIMMLIQTVKSRQRVYAEIRHNQSKFHWSSLTNSDIRNHYTVTERNKFATLQETSETVLNMKTLLLPIEKQQSSAYPRNQESNVVFHGNQLKLKKNEIT